MLLTPLLILSSQHEPLFEVAAGMRAFTPEFVSALQSRPDQNFVASPFSVSSCLALLLPGVGRADAAKLMVALHLPSSVSKACEGFKQLNADLSGPRNGSFLIANSIWTGPGFALAPAYVATVHDSFGAEARALRDAGPRGVKEVNDWINDKTLGRIRNLLKELGGATSAVLVNAVSFEGTWQHEFNPAKTESKPFHGAHGSGSVPMMAQIERANYLREPGFEAVELFYRGEQFSLTVVLPRAGTDPLAILKKLDWDSMKRSRPAEVDFELPKFKFSSSYDLMRSLKTLGLASLETHLDTRPMLQSPQSMRLSQLLHGAEIEVDEKGTRAAAATIGVVSRAAIIAAPEKVVFHVDRPFGFILRHVATGTPLFVGAVYDPSR